MASAAAAAEVVPEVVAEVVEWCLLPRELLYLISKHLPSDIDLLRFRSVCSSWRTSTPPPKHHPSFPSRFPILPNKGFSDTSWGFHLSKRTLYHLRLPHSHIQTPKINNPSWIIKLEIDMPKRDLDNDAPNRAYLVSPLSRAQFKPLPPNFPKRFDFSKFQVFELGHEYALQYINFRPLANSIGDAGNLYMEKVALSSEGDGIFVLLTIHVSGKLVMYKSRDKKWTVIDDLPSPYDDVICTDGKFYAVDNTGRTVLVNFDGSGASVSVVARSVYGGDKKFLVESRGNLLLVDMYLSVGPEDDLGYVEGFEFYEDFDCYMSERTVRFKIFEWDKEGGSWIEINSLGDRVVFLGENCTFSASASEIDREWKGNCVFFTDQFYNSKEADGVWKSRGVGVFDLENDSIGPICNYPGYSDLFWPPPDWIYSTATIEEGLNQLSI